MDGRRFDELSRLLSRGVSRRGALKTALGAILAGGTAAAAATDSEAAGIICRELGQSCNSTNRKCCPLMTCHAGTKTCRGNSGAPGCGTDSALCNSGLVCTGNFCGKRKQQIGQTCTPTGKKGSLFCDTGLTCDLTSRKCLGQLNKTGCATNNALCVSGLVCRIDTCLAPAALGESCDQDADCTGDYVCKSNLCANACIEDGDEACTLDEDCCTADSICSGGVCVPGCCDDNDCIKDYEGNVFCIDYAESADDPYEIICTTNAECADIYGDCNIPGSTLCVCISGAVNDIFFDFSPPDNRGYCYELFFP